MRTGLPRRRRRAATLRNRSAIGGVVGCGGVTRGRFIPQNGSVERYDVVVVGGGPAGSVAAHAAARAGARVLVIERSPRRPPRCTGLVGPRILDLLGIPPRFVLREIRAVRVHAPSGGSVEFRSATPKGYVLDRAGLDRWLLEQAAKAGAAVRCPTAAVGVEGRVLRTTGGPVGFGVLVAADGATSGVRRWAGFPPPAELVVGVQAVVELPSAGDGDRVDVHIGAEVAPAGFAWVVPAEEGLARVGLLTPARREAMPLLSRFLARRCPGQRVVRRENGLVPIGPPPRTVGERVLLVGDAAGQVKPLTGGGLLFGSVAARIAGEIATRQPDRLAEYETRWRATVGDEISFGLRGRKAFLALGDDQLDRIVALLDRPSIRHLVATEADIDQLSRLARACVARPQAWATVMPLVRALGGWTQVKRIIHGLPVGTEPG